MSVTLGRRTDSPSLPPSGGERLDPPADDRGRRARGNSGYPRVTSPACRLPSPCPTTNSRSARRIRELAENEIAPHAADCDEHERFPVEAQKALTAAGFQAVHVPEEFGGAGADALSTVIVIEEVARVCASSSLIPAVNKLGSMPIILSGSEALKRAVLPSVASGESMISYALSEREAGSDAGCDADRRQWWTMTTGC